VRNRIQIFENLVLKSFLLFTYFVFTETPILDGLGTTEEIFTELSEKSYRTNTENSERRMTCMTAEEHSLETVTKYVSEILKQSVENAIVTILNIEKMNMNNKGERELVIEHVNEKGREIKNIE
jgi:hypothetical protein